MEARKIDLSMINLNRLDNSNWNSYRFDEIAKNISERVDPNNTNLEVYIGLEHIDSESLHIRRSGKPDDVNGQKLKFYKGDIIFGRRRAYQRKAGIAKCDGFCSAHALVLRANSAIIDPQLFPFFMHSDLFMNRAVDISVGSLSPTINWGTLKDQEFKIPPKEIQSQLSEMLLLEDRVLQRNIFNNSALENYYSTVVDNLFSVPNESWDYLPLSSVAKINENTLNSKTDKNYEFSYLDLTSIEGPKLLGNMCRMKYADAPSRAKRVVKNHSSIIALVRPYQQAIVYVENADDIISSTGTAVVNAKQQTNSRFLFHQFFAKRFLRFCERMMTGTSYPAITADDLALYKVAMPKHRHEQDEISKKLDAIEKSQKLNIEAVRSSFELQKSLINQVFQG